MIAQVGLEIPLDIQKGLLSGDLFRHGGIVRDAAGQIVKHLKEVQLPEAGETTTDHLAATLKRSKVIAVTAIGVAAAGAAAFAIARRKGRGSKEYLLRKAFNDSLNAYLGAIEERCLDLDATDRLIADFDAIRNFSEESDGIVVHLDLKKWEVLLGFVSDYTSKLAEANSVDLNELLEREAGSEQNIVVDLRRYLEVQRKIFADAA